MKKVLTNRSNYYIVVVMSNVKKSCKTFDVEKLKNRFTVAILLAEEV